VFDEIRRKHAISLGIPSAVLSLRA
jgi:hypothetical protein